jgi:hypothetical protein
MTTAGPGCSPRATAAPTRPPTQSIAFSSDLSDLRGPPHQVERAKPLASRKLQCKTADGGSGGGLGEPLARSKAMLGHGQDQRGDWVIMASVPCLGR